MIKNRRPLILKTATFFSLSILASFSLQRGLRIENFHADAVPHQRERQQVQRAYVTLIASPEYDIGAQILVCRLRHFSPDIPIYVLVDASVQLQSNSFYNNLHAELIPVVNPTVLNSSLSAEVRSGTYAKLNVWQLDFIEKALYLDADVVPVKNPEVLFPLLADDKDFAVVGKYKRRTFNSGVFVYRPSNATFNVLLERLRKNDYAKMADPTEQDLLISHFGRSINTTYIDGNFNYRPLHHNDGLGSDAAIVHYIGNPKPWTHILGRNSSIEGQAIGVRGRRTHLPQWSIQLYMNEVERYFSYCHDHNLTHVTTEAEILRNISLSLLQRNSTNSSLV